MTRAGLSIPSFGLKVKLMAKKREIERATACSIFLKERLNNFRKFRVLILCNYIYDTKNIEMSYSSEVPPYDCWNRLWQSPVTQ